MKRLRLCKRLQRWVLSLLLPAFAMLGSPLQANPRGGRVVRGNADIIRVNQNHLKIHQKSHTAVINWDNFSINQGQLTRFHQPGRNASVLNRVTSGDISRIHGQLKANGNVTVINPNGIVIGRTGVIDVAGNAVLSTLDIDNDDFMDGGVNNYTGGSTTGITNKGTITSTDGDVILMGGFVDNDGQIGALNGTIAIGSGGDILVSEGNGSKISIKGASEHDGTGISNTGTIRGASAELKAHGNVYALAINNGGAIRASGATRANGRVRLQASGTSSNINLGGNIAARAGTSGGDVSVSSSGGNVRVDGNIDASGTVEGGSVSIEGGNVVQAVGSTIDVSGSSQAGSATLDATETMTVAGAIDATSDTGSGGDITVTGAEVFINDGASLSADGFSAGGTVKIGGDFQGRDTGLREADRTVVEADTSISADSGGGDAGTAIVWANGSTLFLGDISARASGAIGNGGLVEVSGKEDLYFDGSANVSSANGASGTVLFDPGDVVVGSGGSTTAPLGQPTFDSLITIESVNDTLQSGANVLIVTGDGNILFDTVTSSQGGFDNTGNLLNDRHVSVQWTNSKSSLGAFAGENIVVENHIRTSGSGSINLIAGWAGDEGDGALAFDPQTAWDFYVGQGMFGENNGSVFVGTSTMVRHVIVGSRFGDTNVAGFNVSVIGSDTNNASRFAQIGFHDAGAAFAPRHNQGNGGVLDLTNDLTNQWYLSDGLNEADNNLSTTADRMPHSGEGSPVVAVVGMYEVDINGDGVMDGVRGITSAELDIYDGTVDGVLEDTYIPYANHFNSTASGNWWWQQIDAAARTVGHADYDAAYAASETLGGLRPEYGAGSAVNGADINVLARGNVLVRGGSGREETGAQIGHGGVNRNNWGGAGTSVRSLGNETVGNAGFSITTNLADPDQIVEQGQIERRWSFNGSTADRNSTAIARLAPVYGNINVLAGVDTSLGVAVNHNAGTVSATVGEGGSVIVRAAQDFEFSVQSHNSYAQIGHGGVGQFGEFYGDIHVEAGNSVLVQAGNATRSHATIGHTFNGHAYWNPTNVEDQQLRFFATTGDFDNPNMRRGELFSGNVTTGFDPTLDPEADRRYTLANFPLDAPGPDGMMGTADDINSTLGYNPLQYTRGFAGTGSHSQGLNALAPLDIAPLGPVVVEALDGSVLSGMHGSVDVIAHNGKVDVIGHSSPLDATQARDRRFAGIGHGGSSFAFWTEGSGYQNIAGSPTIPTNGADQPDAREIIVYEIGDTVTGSRSQIGNSGRSERGRSVQNMTITGDINVVAGGDLNVIAGNDIYDYAQIGHHAAELADHETSSFMLGDINVSAGGNLTLIGGGLIENQGRINSNYDLRSWSKIGHGGYRTGFMNYTGDIQVDARGDLTITGGAFALSSAKIGHQGVEDYGQVGGDFVRVENFIRDNNSVDINTNLGTGGATVDYDFTTDGFNTLRSFDEAGTLLGDRNTADISVTARGEILLNHLPMGKRLSDRQLQWYIDNNTDPASQRDPENQGQGARTRRSFSMIGHGGRNVDAINEYNNEASNFGDKIGDITVVSETGSVTLLNGEGEERWTRIGHGTVDDRVNGTLTTHNSAMELAGNITVQAAGDVIVDASFADANEVFIDSENAALFGTVPSRWNPVVIGHGAIRNALDIVVLGSGENVNGIEASSDIAVSGRNVQVLGGDGREHSFAQIGHGFNSDQGNDASRRLNRYTGFTGDISIVARRDLLVEGGENAWIEVPDDIEGTAASVIGAYAAIGHGGYQVDAPSRGDIAVYVGRDATVQGQARTDEESTTIDQSGYNIANPDTGAVASAFNFAKIGHFSVENSNRQGGNGDLVQNANIDGDIVVVVNRDLAVLGGTTPNIDTQTIYGAFAQIGHGGPGIAGDLEGNILVLAKRNLSVINGASLDRSALTTREPNNYAMIGNGDRILDPESNPAALFRTEGQGFRTGDIIVGAGRNGVFQGAQVAHSDPRYSSQTTFGDTLVAVSRRNPFYGGKGNLVATEGSYFGSGSFGVGSTLRLLMPARSNNMMDATTRLNEANIGFVIAPNDFQGLNKPLGELAGRADEVYLTPDLWWDQSGVAADAGFLGGGLFPGDASGDHGGAIAQVMTPGGLPNLTGLIAGALGSSATTYRDTNGVSGSGLYTLYYDAIEAVDNSLPAPLGLPDAPGIPPVVFDFATFQFLDFFDTYDRYQEFVGNEYTGVFDPLTGAAIGVFETNAEEAAMFGTGFWSLEDRLDNVFGDRRDSLSDEELAEEIFKQRDRGANGVGPIGLTFYIWVPGTNYYSSYRVFGSSIEDFYPLF